MVSSAIPQTPSRPSSALWVLSSVLWPLLPSCSKYRFMYEPYLKGCRRSGCACCCCLVIFRGEDVHPFSQLAVVVTYIFLLSTTTHPIPPSFSPTYTHTTTKSLSTSLLLPASLLVTLFVLSLGYFTLYPWQSTLPRARYTNLHPLCVCVCDSPQLFPAFVCM